MADLQKEKIIKLRDSTKAFMKVEADSVTMGSSPENRIMTNAEHGNFVVGPTVFTSHPEKIKMGGVFQINGLNTSTMASTIVTPIPMFTFSFPLEDTISFLNEALIDVAGLL